MNKIFGAVATFVAAASFAVSASAVTIEVSDGDAYNISDGDLFYGSVANVGGSGSLTVEFTSVVDLLAGANASLTNFVAGTFDDLTMSWISATGTTSIAVLAGITNLETLFIDPDTLIQSFMLSWSGSLGTGPGFNFDISGSNYVANTPLPASLLLMLTALAGLVVVSRFRHKATAV